MLPPVTLILSHFASFSLSHTIFLSPLTVSYLLSMSFYATMIVSFSLHLRFGLSHIYSHFPSLSHSLSSIYSRFHFLSLSNVFLKSISSFILSNLTAFSFTLSTSCYNFLIPVFQFSLKCLMLNFFKHKNEQESDQLFPGSSQMMKRLEKFFLCRRQFFAKNKIETFRQILFRLKVFQ